MNSGPIVIEQLSQGGYIVRRWSTSPPNHGEYAMPVFAASTIDEILNWTRNNIYSTVRNN